MRSIQRRFNKISTRSPELGSYICLARAIINHKFSRQMIGRWFQKLVDKDDYSKNEKKGLLSHLENLSNLAEDNKKKG